MAAHLRADQASALQVVLCFAFDHRSSGREVAEFKRRLIDCEHVVHALELSGSFDFMIEALVADLPTYKEKLESLSEPISRLVARYEASFICRCFDREELKNDQGLWVRTRAGIQRISCEAIDKIVAERDYMRLCCGRQSWLYHATMASLLDRLDPQQFVQIHRSMVVRRDFIDRLLHKDHRWIARLRDGTEQRLSKSHVGHVLHDLRNDSSKTEAHSSNRSVTIENQ